MRRTDRDTVEQNAAIVCVVAIAGMLMVSNPWARAILAPPLVLVAPGYAVVAALFPRGSQDAAERWLLIPVASLVVAILSGLLLHVTPWGLQPASWGILLAAVTAVAGLLAFLRHRRDGRAMSPSLRPGVSLGQGTLLAVAALVLGLALLLARTPAPPTGYVGYTMLWLAPQPRGEAPGWQLGIESAEFARLDYRLQLKIGEQMVYEWPSITLAPGEQWATDLAALPDIPQRGALEAILYRNDVPGEVYRKVAVRDPDRPNGDELSNEKKESANLAGK
jgi:hypothetical protein